MANNEEIEAFLKNNFAPNILNFEMINGGEGSQAYGFSVSGQGYIIRVNKHYSLGFKKDEFAFTHYSALGVPIPKIYQIGKINDQLHYCISQKVEGKIVSSLKSADFMAITHELFKVLDAIHSADVSHTRGYGKWDAEGKAESKSWREQIMSVDAYAKSTPSNPGLFETSFLEKSFWDKVQARLSELLPYCPEERYLVHGDYGFNNVFSDGSSITGVIDWEGSLYGDFLFDVAWLSFWSQNLNYQELYLKHTDKKGVKIEHFKERVLCYKLYIGLGTLSFYAYSQQKDKYEKVKETLGKLI